MDFSMESRETHFLELVVTMVTSNPLAVESSRGDGDGARWTGTCSPTQGCVFSARLSAPTILFS